MQRMINYQGLKKQMNTLSIILSLPDFTNITAYF